MSVILTTRLPHCLFGQTENCEDRLRLIASMTAGITVDYIRECLPRIFGGGGSSGVTADFDASPV